MYQVALNKNGYKYDLAFTESDNEMPHTEKNWLGNIIWYSPLYSESVEANIGKCFLY